MSGEAPSLVREKLRSTILAEEEVSLLLREYDDIFSDFDPRAYSKRALSQDFLAEMKRATIDKYDALELRLLIPRSKRNMAEESVIRTRLHEHFKKHHELLEREVAATKRKGVFMALGGTALLLVAAVLSAFNPESFLTHVLLVLLEPAGWFTAWTGLDQIYYTANQKKEDLEFYHKMARTTVIFLPY